MNQSRNISVFFSLSLLFLFAGCTFLLLVTQIQGSQMIQSQLESSYQKYTPISYLTMKIHTYDFDDGVMVDVIDGIDCLILQDLNTKTYIYEHDGSLKEYYVIKDMQPDLKDGEVLFPCSFFKVQKQDNKVIGNIDGEEFIVNIRSETYAID